MKEIAFKHNILLYCLPPKTTHQLQPLDVGVFGPLQNAWNKHCQECMVNRRAVTRDTVIQEYMAICELYMVPKPIESAHFAVVGYGLTIPTYSKLPILLPTSSPWCAAGICFGTRKTIGVRMIHAITKSLTVLSRGKKRYQSLCCSTTPENNLIFVPWLQSVEAVYVDGSQEGNTFLSSK